MNVHIENFNEMNVARVRHIGPYNEIRPCFERLFGWVGSINARSGRVFTLSYDDPDTVAADSLRSDACVELSTEATPPPGISLDTLAAGRYAVYTHQGPYDGIPKAYKNLFNVWLPQSGEQMDDRPFMEIYQNSPADTAPEDLLTDLCLPLKSP